MADDSPSPPGPSSSSTSPPSLSTVGKSFVPGNTMYTRFVNFSNMALGRMSKAGSKEYWTDADARYASSDCKTCETNRDFLLQYSPIVRYMSDNITRLGGDISKKNIRCRSCKTGMEGGFDKEYGIVLCANYVDTRSKVEDALSHEMVHAYDHLRFKVDWEAADLRHVACTEIRASNLSGECRWVNEFFGKRQFKFTMHQQDCVRRRAVLSVRSRPACKDDLQAVKVVNEVWDSCFTDTRPFDEVFR